MQHKEDPKVSAVVLNWKRPDNVKTIVRYLEKRTFIDEVLVWNNSPTPLDVPAASHKTRVINARENSKDHAKYLACSEAKNDVCFYQDDDWHTAAYLDLMYAAFCLNPQHIHTVTNAPILAENLFWTYYNGDDLHADFSWIGCGALFPRKTAMAFLTLIDSRFDKAMRGMSDRAFTCLGNQPVVQIEAPLYPLDQAHAFSAEERFSTNKAAVINSIHVELPALACPLDPLPDYRIRAINENIALFSTIEPIDYPYRQIRYRGKEEFEARKVETLKNASFERFIDHSYARALGPNPDRKWKAMFNKNDQWGISVSTATDIEILIESDNADLNDWTVTSAMGEKTCSFAKAAPIRFNDVTYLRLCYDGDLPRLFDIKVKRLPG